MDERARDVVARLAASLDTPYLGSSSMTPCVYDTAWVSMVSKPETHDGVTTSHWLFPECFQSVLGSQSPDGAFGFSRGAGAPIDGILDTMAALLSLLKHHKSPDVKGILAVPPPDLPRRIEKAREYLNDALQRWDVRSTIHVGFEVLVPTLLRMLEEEGVNFRFPGRRALMTLNRRRVGRGLGSRRAMLDAHQKTTLLHSLEGFVGILDFGNISHGLTKGSMMGSPASTAAYLMIAPRWSKEAEDYLRFVVTASKGAIPSAFPISVFEASWVLSTLLASGFTPEELGAANVRTLADYLQARLEENNGVTGFAPEILADADDTAKSIYSLRLLNRPASCDAMLKVFEAPASFNTYSIETRPSLSANCNVLIALLACNPPSRHISQIAKALKFLSDSWYEGRQGDKWNVEPQYSMMLLVNAMSRVVRLWDDGALNDLPPELLTNRLPLVTLQILVRTLSIQSPNGSWKGSVEITAYALLTLKALIGLPWVSMLGGFKVNESIDLGTVFLLANQERWRRPEMIWIEKVTYGSSILCEAYCTAALKAKPPSTNCGDKASALCKIPAEKLDRFAHFFSSLPVFSREPSWRLRASLAEGFMLGSALRRAMLELDVFPLPQGRYLEYIPCTWTMCNNAGGFGLSTQTMVDMMVISTLNFQIDKWLEEATADDRLEGDFSALRTVIKHVFDEVENRPNDDSSLDGHQRKRRQCSNGNCQPVMNRKTALLCETQDTLSHFVQCVLSMTPATLPVSLRRRVLHELSTFVFAHVAHGEDNARLSKTSEPPRKWPVVTNARGTYFDWVRTTSADDTSCPYSFEFFRCLVSSSICAGTDCFPGMRAQYLGQAASRHLATMCRQYNDYGSMARDLEEHNLNSVNFAEFYDDEEEGSEGDESAEKAGRRLLELADYERECLSLTLKRLRPEITPSAWKAWNVFVDVTDLYGQIYVVRDINSDGVVAS
ncbi:hypothetical protein RJ55_10009 [Drechmeria coniospora]|nr:hypothetical protein RJ55_10009 [Drechmeria coniospora]